MSPRIRLVNWSEGAIERFTGCCLHLKLGELDVRMTVRSDHQHPREQSERGSPTARQEAEPSAFFTHVFAGWVPTASGASEETRPGKRWSVSSEPP